MTLTPATLTLGQQLAAATDKMNAAIAEVEKALAELCLGVTTSVSLKGDFRLVFGKTAGVWVLTVEGPNDFCMRLVNCNRELRLSAVGALDALVTALLKTAAEELAVVESTTAIAANLACRIRGVQS